MMPYVYYECMASIVQAMLGISDYAAWVIVLIDTKGLRA